MKTLERFTRWMEKNLEQPFYQAEVARAEFQRGNGRNSDKDTYREIGHRKVALSSK